MFDFNLSDEDMAEIDKLDTGLRGGPDPDVLAMRRFEMKIDD